MFSVLRRRMTYANVVATLAMVFAMSGGAYAASKYLITSTKQIKPSVLASLKGKNGAAGAAGAQGPAGPAGGPGAKGENGAAGKEGLPGKEGSAGKEGKTGPAGATGPEGVCSTANCVLPNGASETGTWSQNAFDLEEDVEIATAISFPIHLKEASEFPAAHAFYFDRAETETIKGGGTVGTSGCKIENNIPKAPSGVLCVYTEQEALGSVIFQDIGSATTKVQEQYGPAGVFIFFKATGEPASIRARGIWAVTAP